MKRTHPRHKSRKQKRAMARHTHKMRSCAKKDSKAIITENFLEMLNEIKIYHWNTHSFAQHKATDELYSQLNEHVDKFVEVMLGKKGDRITKLSKHIPLHTSTTTKSLRDKIYQFRDYLIHMEKCLHPSEDTDLLNIRDEILADMNQFLYLLTLNK